MNLYPQRPLSHNLEAKSELFFKNHLPPEWIVDKPTDYGIDYKIDIVLDGNVTGHNFSVQLKAHQTVDKGRPVVITLGRSTINFYLNRLEPILLVCFVAERNEGYYKWFYESTVDLTKKHTTFSILFDENQKISNIDWAYFVDHVKSIFSRKFMLNALPEINFSTIEDGDEKTAMAFYVSGEYELAEHLFKKLNNKNNNVGWLNTLAMCQYALYRYKEALFTINKALALNDSHQSRVNKACILAEFGAETRNLAMLKEAESVFQKAIQEYSDANCFYNYANVSASLGNYEVAELNYKKSLKLNPNNAKAWKNLGQIYSGRNKQKKELECYDNALSIDPNLPQALFGKGVFLIKEEKKFTEGLMYLEQAKHAQPKLFLSYEDGYFWFAFAHMQVGDIAAGQEYLRNGLFQYPGNLYLLNLKREYFKDNWQSNEVIKAEAKDFLLYRLSLTPNDMASLEILCKIYLSEGNLTAAFEQIKLRTAMFGKSDIESLINERIDLGDYLSCFYSYGDYCQFRVQFSLFDLVNGKIATSLYLELTELVGLKIFHETIGYIKRYRKEKEFEGNLIKLGLDLAIEYYPRTAVYIITKPVDNTKEFGHQISQMIVGLPILAIKECARIVGYLSTKFQLNSARINEALDRADEQGVRNTIWEKGCDLIQERFHFWPEK